MVFLKTSLADLIRSLEATAPACGRPQPRAHPAEVLRDMPSLGLTTANKIQTIVRACHNYVWTGEGKNAPKGTPATRLGLAKAPLDLNDILYFR